MASSYSSFYYYLVSYSNMVLIKRSDIASMGINRTKREITDSDDHSQTIRCAETRKQITNKFC